MVRGAAEPTGPPDIEVARKVTCIGPPRPASESAFQVIASGSKPLPLPTGTHGV